LNVAAFERDQRRRRTRKGKVRHLQAGLVVEPLDDQVRIAADAERTERDLVGILLRLGN
jgi:hypothetical protein